MLGIKFLVKIILPALIIFMLTSSGLAQENLKEKMNKIEGHVDKITISAGGEEFTFEGEDAEKLFEKMKADRKSVNTFVIKMDDKDSKGTKKTIIKSGDEEVIEFETDGGNHAVWFSDDNSFNNLEKNIKVEIEDGKKKVTVTTTENGEEKTIVYEGDDADEFLEQMKSENGNDFLINIDEKGNYKKLKVIIEEEETK
jgi:biopolymer transport protein ExbD